MKKILIIVVAVVVVIGGTIFAYAKLGPEKIAIPQAITQKLQFPLYLPSWLPDTYTIDKNSMAIQENRVFVFSASNPERNKLYISQQAGPKDFDYNKFYTTQMIDPVKLEGVPFDSYFGKSLYTKATMISIVTDKSWIILSTKAPIDKVLAQKIAQEMKQY